MSLVTTLRGTMLSRAVAAWRADAYDATLDALVDLTGRGHHARFGSTVGADTNDPLLLPYSGEKYLYLPDSNSGNHAFTPGGDLNVAEDLDVRVQATVSSVGSNTVLASKAGHTDPQRSWYFRAADGGPGGLFLQVYWTPDGTFVSRRTVTSTERTPVDGRKRWYRVTVDTNNGADGTTVRFYTGEDGDTWDLLQEITTAGVVPISAGTEPVRVGFLVGSEGTRPAFFYRMLYYDGIDGTLLADFDPSRSQEPHTSFVAATGETWTINRSATGRKAALVDRPLLLFGTDDYLEVADHTALDAASGEDLTVAWVGRLHGTTANTALVAKKANLTTGAGYAIDRGTGGLTPRVMLADGTNNPTATAPALVAGTTTLAALVRNGGLTGVTNGTAGTPASDTSADASNAEALRFGRLSGAGASYSDMEFIGAAIFRRALTTAELARVAREFGVGA